MGTRIDDFGNQYRECVAKDRAVENDNPLVVIILMCFVVFAVLWIIHSLSGRANRSKKKAETPDCPAYLSVAGRKYKISKTLYGTYSCEGKQFNSLKEATDFIENLWEPDMTGDPLDSDPTVVVKQEPPKLDVNLFDANLPSRTKGTRYMGFGIVLLVLGFSIGATIDGGPGNIIAFLGTMLVVFILIIPGFGLFLRGFRDWRSAAGNRLIKTASLVVICLSVVVMFLWDRYDLGTCLENGANWFAGQMALVVGDINEELNEAAWAGDTAKLVKLTEMGGEFTAPPGDYGITLLMRAIERKDYPMVTALIIVDILELAGAT